MYLSLLLFIVALDSACGGRDSQWTAGKPQIYKEDIYARFGPPEYIRDFPDGPLPRPPEEGGPDGFPYEQWHYDHLQGVGDHVMLVFVDGCMCGDYVLNTNSSKSKSVDHIIRGE